LDGPTARVSGETGISNGVVGWVGGVEGGGLMSCCSDVQLLQEREREREREREVESKLNTSSSSVCMSVLIS